MNKQNFIATASNIITDYHEGLLEEFEAKSRLDGVMMVMNNVTIWKDSFERGKAKKEIREMWNEAISKHPNKK